MITAREISSDCVARTSNMLNCSNEIVDLRSVVCSPIQSTTRVCMYVCVCVCVCARVCVCACVCMCVYFSRVMNMLLVCCVVFFLYRGFLSQTLAIHSVVGEGMRPSLFLFTALSRSQTFRYLFATLHVRYIFNRITCNYQAATW